MAFVNVRDKQIQLKIVYYGPGQAGKTTNFLYINENFNEKIKSKMVAIDTYGDRTIFLIFSQLIWVKSIILTLKFNFIQCRDR